MSANVFGAKQFKPTAPDKGSFPLDHEGEYLILLSEYYSPSSETETFLKREEHP